MEDGAWLRKKTDYSHINIAELEAVLKGINLALKWNLKDIEIKSDSVTVVSWIRNVIEKEQRNKSKA